MNGMLEGQESYNGTVSVMGQQVKVENGKAVYEGEQFFVSPSGETYIDANGRMVTVGRIINGVFQEVKPQQPPPALLQQAQAGMPQQPQQPQMQMPQGGPGQQMQPGGMLGGMR